uniref:Uncharacterized protein n=1 Tax=Rhizophora mucronata TaxID=61149 RepID=A0A2P2QSC3_RHIMU
MNYKNYCVPYFYNAYIKLLPVKKFYGR